jgi:hypothetical protein
VLFGVESTLPAALALVCLYGLLTLAATFLIERSLLGEILGYLRGRGGLRARAEVA